MMDERNVFDARIRAILENAAEEVPAGAWAGIEKRLPSKKVRTVPLWAGVFSGIAAAAAAAAAFFLSGTSDSTFSDRQYDRLALASGDDIIRIENRGTPSLYLADIPAAQPLKEIMRPVFGEETEAESGSTDVTTGISDSIAEGTGTAGTIEEEKSIVREDSMTAKPENAAPEETYGTDWAEIMAADERQGRRIRTSITLSGNAISNSNPALNRQNSAIISYRPNKNTPKKDVVSESGESSYSVPVSFGVGVKIDFTKRWALGVGVNYSHLSRTFTGTFFDYEDGVLVSDNTYSNILNKQDYIGIPLNVYFSILSNSFIDFYAYAGGTAEKCVSNRFQMSAEGTDIHHREAVEGFQFSVNAGLGMEFIIADLFGIYIDPSLRYYFPDARQPHSIRTAQPLMFGLELGFRIRL